MIRNFLLKLLLLSALMWNCSSNAQQSRIVYETPNDPQLFEAYRAWQELGLLEGLRDQVLRKFNIQNSLSLSLRNCKQANAFYRAESKEVVICWEMMPAIISSTTKRFEKNGDLMTNAVTSAFVFVVYHELGHAMVEILRTPTFGREEDNADQIATVILLEDLKRKNHAESNMAVLAIFDFWRSRDAPYLKKHQLADEHSLGQQRAFNIVCWAIGSDPVSRYKYLAQMTGFPTERIGSCVKEFQRAEASLKLLAESSATRR